MARSGASRSGSPRRGVPREDGRGTPLTLPSPVTRLGEGGLSQASEGAAGFIPGRDGEGSQRAGATTSRRPGAARVLPGPSSWSIRGCLGPRPRDDNSAAAKRRLRRQIRNFPLPITWSPSNQMSKLRPTMSMCVVARHSAPVCSVYGCPNAMCSVGSFSSWRIVPDHVVERDVRPDRELADAVRVLVRGRVGLEVVDHVLPRALDVA